MIIDISYGKRQFSVEAKERAGQNISIAVHPDLRIIAKFPLGADRKIIERWLLKKASWISKQLDYFSAFYPFAPERKYISGEAHYYLGRQYRLKISKSKKAEIKLKGRYFVMTLQNSSDNIQAKKLMIDWYTEHGSTILTKRVKGYLSRFIKLGAKEPVIKFRKMEKRWGSCSKKGTITFNLDLIKAPIPCIDYVIVHELCHLLYLKHDRNFYCLLEKILPDWEKHKNRLEKAVI